MLVRTWLLSLFVYFLFPLIDSDLTFRSITFNTSQVVNTLSLSLPPPLPLSLLLSCHTLSVWFTFSITLITPLRRTVRNRGYVAGSKVDDVLARTQYLLDNGLLLEAVKELVSPKSALSSPFYPAWYLHFDSFSFTSLCFALLCFLILCSVLFFSSSTWSQNFPVTSISHFCTTIMFNCIE